MKRVIVFLFILAAAALLGWTIYRRITARAEEGQPGARRSAAVAVEAVPVRRGTIRDVGSFTGTLLADSQFVVAPKVPGRLEKLMVNIGDEIKQGDLIAVLDSQEYSQQVEQARAELEVAKANLAECKSALDVGARDFNRVGELFEQKVASEAERDSAEANLRACEAKHEVALAQIRQRQAALKAAEVRLSYTRIEAAWEKGADVRLVAERFVDEGTMLRANDPIIQVVDVSNVTAVIHVIERDFPEVRMGQEAVITTDAYPGREFFGKIVRRAPVLKEDSRQARVEIAAPNPERLLAPGMFVRVRIQFAQHDNATLIPPAALVRRNGNRGVFLADPVKKTARFVQAKTGIVNGEAVEILEPQLEGLVVVLGHHLLEDGGGIILPEDKASSSPDSGRGRNDSSSNRGRPEGSPQ